MNSVFFASTVVTTIGEFSQECLPSMNYVYSQSCFHDMVHGGVASCQDNLLG